MFDDEIDFLLESILNDRLGMKVDKMLVWFDKPLEKLRGDTISVFHGSKESIQGYIKPFGINVGATNFSNPRWSTYLWDNLDNAIKWALLCAMCENYSCVMDTMSGGLRLLLAKPKSLEDSLSNEEFIKLIERDKIIAYVYECKININDLEIGSAPSIKEYTVSKPMKIYKTHKILVNKDVIDKYFKIVDREYYKEFKKKLFEKGPTKSRNWILNSILNNNRDWNGRGIIKGEIRKGNIKIGDDISDFKKIINKASKQSPESLFPEKYKKYKEK